VLSPLAIECHDEFGGDLASPIHSPLGYTMEHFMDLNCPTSHGCISACQSTKSLGHVPFVAIDVSKMCD